MSYEACGWALKQRGIRPVLKVVLWNLCDRYHPDNGCFPSQETLAEDCEVSRSALNTHLDDLEERGLIAREQRRKAGSNQQERTRYRFAFEPDFKPKNAEKPCPENGHGAVSENGTEPSPENGESRVQNLDSNLVREPVREPVIEREGGRELSEEDPKLIEKQFDGLVIGRSGNPWPKVLSSSRDWALRQFVKLAPDERQKAVDKRDAYLAACDRIKSGPDKGKPNPVALGIYLRDKLFNLVDAVAPPRPATPAASQRIPVAPLGPLWAALRIMPLLKGAIALDMPLDVIGQIQATYGQLKAISDVQAKNYLARKGLSAGADGQLIIPEDFEQSEWRRQVRDSGYPEVNRLHEQAARHERGLADAALAPLADLCEPVPVDSDLFEEWRVHHEAMNWPFVPKPGRMPVVWFPRGGPDGLADFERAADAVMMAKDRGDEHAA